MPDQPQSSTVQIVSLVINCIQTIIIAWLTSLATQNHNKLDTVQANQQEAVVKTEEVKKQVEDRAVVADQRAVVDAKATAANLYGTWFYLQDTAVTPAQKAKADDAKKTYDEFVAKNGLKK